MAEPVFVIGVPRSGTTMLRWMINSGGRIFIPAEAPFVARFFHRRPHEELTEPEVARMLGIIEKDYPLFLRKWRGLHPTAAELMEQMSDPTPAVFLDTIYSAYAEQFGAHRWGDKTPINTNYVPLLADMFPDARFVHIVRDARDVALSTEEKWGDRAHVDLYYSSASWAARTRAVERAAQLVGPDLVLTVRYEDLIADPEGRLREISAFLGEPFVPEMAKPHLLARQQLRRRGFSAPVRTPPNSANAAKWRTAMSPADQRLVQAVAGDVLREYGYETPDLGPMPASERARLAGLAAKYRTLQAGRRSAQAIGLAHPN